MGIKKLIELIKKNACSSIQEKTILDYKNAVIGIDGNLLIYKLVLAIRSSGKDIKNNNTIVTHIHALLVKLLAFHKYKIVPIFVFDNRTPEIKINEINKRSEQKQKLIEKYKQSNTDKDKRILYYINSRITEEEFEECRFLIEMFNFPIIDAYEEADSQLAYLYKAKLVDYIASDDLDILLFGGGKILKNFTIDKTKKITEINLKKLLSEMKITQKQLINIGILLGSDYCQNKNISPNKAFALISKYEDINNIPNEEYINTVPCDGAINYFLEPEVLEIEKIAYTPKVSSKSLIKFLKIKEFSEDYINKIIEKLK
jgi:flap endonuclease-1